MSIPAFAGREIFDFVEAETADVTEGADLSTVEGRGRRLSALHNQCDTSAPA
jgi:hypothetical protein